MNMKEIAEKAGVSVATVSYVLNGTGNVSGKKLCRSSERRGMFPTE